MDNYNYIKYLYIILLIQSLTLCGFRGFAQDRQDIQLANEYVTKGEKEKALLMFQQLVKKNENIPFVHTSYFNLLVDMGKFNEAEDYVEKLIRKDDKLSYRLDLGVLYFRSGNLPKAEKYLSTLIKAQGDDIYKLKTSSDYLASKNLTEYAVMALKQARIATGNESVYALELANLYRMAGKRDEMVEEYLNYVTQTPSNISYIKNVMQILITKPEELESLEKLLLDRIQKNQDSEVFSDLVIWVNLQQKNFYGAFVQARAYDKRFRKEQSKTLEIAQIALNNQDYENADKSFSYVIKEFAGTENELPARMGLIKAREAKVKKNYPVNRDSVRYVIGEYKRFKKSYPDNPHGFEASLNQALLHGYYLDEMDSAIYYLQGLIANNKVAPSMKSKAKIDLGDIYLLKEEPWEATLLYSQVEKTQRETPLGYEAKLRNAKLSYFKGDFKLAQEHLDILKQATTREIANDAMELSMRIKENITFDTTGTALKEYASIELLMAQNKIDTALSRLSTFSATSADQQIKDDVYWLEASLRLKKGEFEKALELCEKIVTEFGEDILADDAYFMEGEIQERYLKNKDKAMEIYREFLTKYPGSVYVAEARKRYRVLRGDFSELPIN
jgi:tetratricopeptide (TPR) repeat protein